MSRERVQSRWRTRAARSIAPAFILACPVRVGTRDRKVLRRRDPDMGMLAIDRDDLDLDLISDPDLLAGPTTEYEHCGLVIDQRPQILRFRRDRSAAVSLATLRQVRRVSAQLRDKAVSSLRRGIAAFNSPDDDGRQTAVLLHLQHAAEMTLKAGLTERRRDVFDKRSGRSLGFDRCLALAREHLAVTDDEAGTLRTIDSLRDDEQHWLAEVSEELLFLHARATVGVIDALFEKTFSERVADHLPDRALPLTSKPLDDFDVLVNSQYDQISELLQTGKRRRSEARAKIRGMLAMEAHLAEDVRVSERDVNRVERGVKDGKPLEAVFPRLREISANVESEGPSVKVHFTKREGAPVHFVPADDPGETAAVREVDLQKKYHWSATALADKLGLTSPKATALRRHLEIDEDPDCVHKFTFGNLDLIRYSDNALTKMRAETEKPGFDMDTIWEENRTRYTRR